MTNGRQAFINTIQDSFNTIQEDFKSGVLVCDEVKTHDFDKSFCVGEKSLKERLKVQLLS